MISSSFRQIHVTTRVSRFARLKKKIPWQILFIIYHIPYRRKPRLHVHVWSRSNGELCGLQTVLWDYAYTCTHMLITTLFDCRYSSIRIALLCGRPIENSLSPTVRPTSCCLSVIACPNHTFSPHGSYFKPLDKTVQRHWIQCLCQSSHQTFLKSNCPVHLSSTLDPIWSIYISCKAFVGKW